MQDVQLSQCMPVAAFTQKKEWQDMVLPILFYHITSQPARLIGRLNPIRAQ